MDDPVTKEDVELAEQDLVDATQNMIDSYDVHATAVFQFKKALSHRNQLRAHFHKYESTANPGESQAEI